MILYPINSQNRNVLCYQICGIKEGDSQTENLQSSVLKKSSFRL